MAYINYDYSKLTEHGVELYCKGVRRPVGFINTFDIQDGFYSETFAYPGRGAHTLILHKYVPV